MQILLDQPLDIQHLTLVFTKNMFTDDNDIDKYMYKEQFAKATNALSASSVKKSVLWDI